MIRDAASEDAEAIARVHVASWRETYEDLMPAEVLKGLDVGRRARQWRDWLRPRRHERKAAVVCEIDGEVVGFASGIVPHRTSEAEVLTLYLLERVQGHGHGRQLLAALAGRLHLLGAESALLWMVEGSPTAAFYEHLGGQFLDRQQKPFGTSQLTEVSYRWDDITILFSLTLPDG